jgi:hypothetical protein
MREPLKPLCQSSHGKGGLSIANCAAEVARATMKSPVAMKNRSNRDMGFRLTAEQAAYTDDFTIHDARIALYDGTLPFYFLLIIMRL